MVTEYVATIDVWFNATPGREEEVLNDLIDKLKIEDSTVHVETTSLPEEL